MQNLSEQLKLKKENLKKCQTRVTSIDGSSWVEDENKKIEQCIPMCPGFVVDTRPDLRVNFILDKLILGSQDVAQDLDILTSCKVTHILNVSVGIPNFFDGWFIYLLKSALDNPEFPLIDILDECCEFIQKALLSGGCVLVHCNAGVSRSASVVIAYLMKCSRMTLDQAFHFVKRKRSFIKPNEGFMKQLKEYEQKL